MNQLHPSSDEIVDYLHGELPPARDAAIHEHLAGCAECAEARDAEISLTEMLRTRANAQERELPASVVANIWEAVRPARASLWERLSVAFRPAVAVPVLAALAAFLYFGLRTHAPAHAATIDAAYYVNSRAALTAATPLSDEDPVPATLTSVDESH
jgi:anti-sigma factor RsiW